MAYLETRIVIDGLGHIPVQIFIINLIKGKYGDKTEEEIKTLVKEEKTKDIQEFSSKLDNIEEKTDEVYEKVKKKRKI